MQVAVHFHQRIVKLVNTHIMDWFLAKAGSIEAHAGSFVVMKNGLFPPFRRCNRSKKRDSEAKRMVKCFRRRT
jgi:hypothetical protein